MSYILEKFNSRYYLNQAHNAVKIGKTKNVKARFRSIQTASPVKLKLLKIIDVKSGKEARDKEKLFHDKFNHLRLHGEWFAFQNKLKYYIKSSWFDIATYSICLFFITKHL